MSQQNYYELLGLTRTATAEEINQAFREKAIKYHPDKNRADPDASKKFKYITQAYQILNDPQRRKKYDATLPQSPDERPHVSNPIQLWQQAYTIFFEQCERFTPAMDAMRLSRPLILDDEKLLVVGIEPTNASLIGYLETTMTHNHVRRILSELYGKPLDFRMISGMALDEWQSIKKAEEAMRARKAQASNTVSVAKDATGTPTPTNGINPETAWGDVIESITRQWGSVENRTFGQVRARYILDYLPALYRAEDTSRTAGIPEEVLQRHLSRALDRLSTITGIDSGVIGLEYLRYRARVLGGF